MPLRRTQARLNDPVSLGIVCALVLGALTFLLVAAKREARPSGDAHIVAFGPAWHWLVRVLWLFPLGMALCWLDPGLSSDDRWTVALVVAMTAIPLAFVVLALGQRIELRPTGLTQSRAWRDPVTIAWKDVRDVRIVRGSSELVLRDALHSRVRISLWMSGMETVARSLEERLPHLPSAKECARLVRRFRV